MSTLNQMQVGGVVYDIEDSAAREEAIKLKADKLGKAETAADSNKLGGKAPEEYASASVAAAHEASIGDAWVSGKTYAVGDYCISGNRLYKCKTKHMAGSTFSADYWEAVSVAGEIGTIQADIAVLQALGLRIVDGQICQVYKEA